MRVWMRVLPVVCLLGLTAAAGPVFIAHRGNMFGPNLDEENRPEYLLAALREGFDVELDVWWVEEQWYLGHDGPQYPTTLSFLEEHSDHFWVHAKNAAALQHLQSNTRLNVFWHDVDDYTLTSHNIVWIYPGKPLLGGNSVAVMFPNARDLLFQDVRGFCNDEVAELRALYLAGLPTLSDSLSETLVPVGQRGPGVGREREVNLLVFDLDGVLVESQDIHFRCLNQALSEHNHKFMIGAEEHNSTYNGLSTRQKLAMLSKRKGLPVELHDAVSHRKQVLTEEALASISESPVLQNVFDYFKNVRRLPIAVASNCVKSSVELLLTRLGLLPYVDAYFHNSDVETPKPAPDLYLHVFASFGVLPANALVLEDSTRGRVAALHAAAHLLPIRSPDDTSIARITARISEVELPNLAVTLVNIVIPMAGDGSRFAAEGYTLPKPLIHVRGRPMIQWVIDNLRLDVPHRFIFIVRQQHRKEYNLDEVLRRIVGDTALAVVEVSEKTEGAACSVLLARNLIDSSEPLLLANSDQYVEWGENGLHEFVRCPAAGCISTFQASDSKWSFAATYEGSNFVTRVAEKEPISEHATTGIYFWRRGRDFVRFADEMIAANARVRGEFYVCPVFNHAIADGAAILTHDVERMWGLGVPSDLRAFLAEFPFSQPLPAESETVACAASGQCATDTNISNNDFSVVYPANASASRLSLPRYSLCFAGTLEEMCILLPALMGRVFSYTTTDIDLFLALTRPPHPTALPAGTLARCLQRLKGCPFVKGLRLREAESVSIPELVYVANSLRLEHEVMSGATYAVVALLSKNAHALLDPINLDVLHQLLRHAGPRFKEEACPSSFPPVVVVRPSVATLLASTKFVIRQPSYQEHIERDGFTLVAASFALRCASCGDACILIL